MRQSGIVGVCGRDIFLVTMNQALRQKPGTNGSNPQALTPGNIAQRNKGYASFRQFCLEPWFWLWWWSLIRFLFQSVVIVITIVLVNLPFDHIEKSDSCWKILSCIKIWQKKEVLPCIPLFFKLKKIFVPYIWKCYA